MKKVGQVRWRHRVRPAMSSVGQPGILGRPVHERFWAAIKQGLPTEKAAVVVLVAVVAGVSVVVGVRWFRQGGGMPTLQHYFN